MFNSIIINAFEKTLSDYKFNKTVQSGFNGPYNDTETEVRNLSHLIVTTAIYAKIYNKDYYRNQLIDMSERLYSLKNKEGLYKLRMKHGKDECNGVIGHAWIMEGLIYSFRATNNMKFIDLAKNIYEKHIFNPKLGLWNRPDSNSYKKAIDYTFNHQLWFASAAAELYSETNDSKIIEDLNIFFDKLNENFRTNRHGLISHHILNKSSRNETLKSYIKIMLDNFCKMARLPSYEYKEVGYQTFNLYAFAKLHQVFPDKDLWRTKKFIKALKYVNTDQHFKVLEFGNYELDKSLKNEISQEDKVLNVYGYPYNGQGFEIEFINKEFPGYINQRTIDILKEKQLELTYDHNSQSFVKNCIDKVTLNYRIYEYVKSLE